MRAVGDPDFSAFAYLIRLAFVNGENKSLRSQGQVLNIKADQFAATHGSSKT